MGTMEAARLRLVGGNGNSFRANVWTVQRRRATDPWLPWSFAGAEADDGCERMLGAREPRDAGGDLLGRLVDLEGGGPSAEGEPQRCEGAFGQLAHGGQHR